MTSKVIIHSPGMISVDAEEMETDAATIEFVKQTRLYKELVSLVGEERANQIIEGGSQDHSTEPTDIREDH